MNYISKYLVLVLCFFLLPGKGSAQEITLMTYNLKFSSPTYEPIYVEVEILK